MIGTIPPAQNRLISRYICLILAVCLILAPGLLPKSALSTIDEILLTWWDIFSTMNQTGATVNITSICTHFKVVRAVDVDNVLHPLQTASFLTAARRKHLQLTKFSEPITFFLHHWAGACIANQIWQRHEEPLIVLKHLQSLQKTSRDYLYISAQHGFLWHYLLGIGFPEAWNLLPLYCNSSALGPVAVRIARPPATLSSLVTENSTEECMHGFGHAVFFYVATKEDTYANYNALNALRPEAWTNHEEMERVLTISADLCSQAPYHDAIVSCLFGVTHSFHQYPRMPFPGRVDMLICSGLGKVVVHQLCDSYLRYAMDRYACCS